MPDPTKVCVAVGLGFFVELTLEEALAFVSKKDAALSKQVGTIIIEILKYVLSQKLMLHTSRLNSCRRSVPS